ncbi:hypothetical protein [Candidatus Nitrotoga arctica]|uniref:YbgF trimerisation domain-containing protein n=1 Tax=Candidatus Nitrotoga arctica TaxID=453162 RepID=A0ABN8AI51_9PROT|nr:hypothetical protein [Candidatus Nitrotoga arctica]CAG9932415.1 exported protein of unknown function [Candidatus Nitrotoga arctica]
MKIYIFLVFIVVSANAIAQQVPREITDKPTPVKILPKPSPPPQILGSAHQYNQLRDMVQTQANEIKVLSSKIDSLEKQMSRMEGRRRY